MRRRVFLAGALTVAATPVVARSPIQLHDAPRELLSPPFTDGAARNLTLADFRGRVVLLNIWATWCVPCRKEMPMLDALQARLGGAEFHVLALSIDRAGIEAVRSFYEEVGIRHLGLYIADDLRAMMGFGVIGLPTTILIDRESREIARLVGPAEWDSPASIAQLETVIAEGRP